MSPRKKVDPAPAESTARKKQVQKGDRRGAIVEALLSAFTDASDKKYALRSLPLYGERLTESDEQAVRAVLQDTAFDSNTKLEMLRELFKQKPQR